MCHYPQYPFSVLITIFRWASDYPAKESILQLPLQLDVAMWLRSDWICEEILQLPGCTFKGRDIFFFPPSQWLTCTLDSKLMWTWQQDRRRLSLWWFWSCHTSKKQNLIYLRHYYFGSLCYSSWTDFLVKYHYIYMPITLKFASSTLTLPRTI